LPDNRYYHPEYPYQKNQSLLLEEGEHTHLARVMRGCAGETVELVNGRDQLAKARITTIEKVSTTLLLEKVCDQKPLLPPIVLVQPLIKQPKLEYIIEKATELGVSTFMLFPAERSEFKEISPQKLTRLRTITISAMKQCGRLDLPHLEVCPSLARFSFPQTNAFFADLGAEYLKSKDLNASSPTYLFVGPEKGWTENEKTLLSQNAKAISLHPHTLRAETASIAFSGCVAFLFASSL